MGHLRFIDDILQLAGKIIVSELFELDRGKLRLRGCLGGRGARGLQLLDQLFEVCDLGLKVTDLLLQHFVH